MAFRGGGCKDRDAWNGEVGELLQEQLRAPIPALPQAEASMRVTYSEPSGFRFITIRTKYLDRIRRS